MTSRLVSRLITRVARTRRGRDVLSFAALRILAAVDWVERHETDPRDLPPGERHGAAWVARHRGEEAA